MVDRTIPIRVNTAADQVTPLSPPPANRVGITPLLRGRINKAEWGRDHLHKDNMEITNRDPLKDLDLKGLGALVGILLLNAQIWDQAIWGPKWVLQCPVTPPMHPPVKGTTTINRSTSR